MFWEDAATDAAVAADAVAADAVAADAVAGDGSVIVLLRVMRVLRDCTLCYVMLWLVLYL